MISKLKGSIVMRNVISLLCLLFVFSENLYSQVYPVQATVQISPPYSLYLADYVESGSERVALNVFLTDIAKPELNVRFKLRIVGQGITLETKPGYIPAPVAIQSGVPLRLISTDLAEYFNPKNLNFQGISQRQYEQRGMLPEGVYQFCFEVLEYNRGIKISNVGCATAWLILNDPPIINIPRQNEKIKAQSPQNVLFQWTPRHTASPNSAFTTEYEIKMVEVWPETRNPNDAILTSPPILEETTQNTTYVYGPSETPLEPGRRYAFRVRAKSIAGVDEMDLFKNNGYSEVFTFVYGDACDLPTGISISSVSSSRFNLSWDPQFNHTAFKVRYREAGTTNWYENTSTIPETQFNSLKPSTTYEYQVAATCGFFDGAYSTIAKVTTNEEPQDDYSCGVPLSPFNLDPSELVGSLKPGDVIQAGDFQLKLASVTGSNGIFSGEGIIEVPYLNNAKVKTSFTNIKVNKELRLVDGFMNVTGAGIDVIPQGVMDLMDDLTETLNTIDSALTTIEENIPEQVDWTSFVPDSSINSPLEIVTVYPATDGGGGVVIVTSDGKEQRLPEGKNYAVKDDAGNGYLIDKKGNIHKTTAEAVAKVANREYNLVLTFKDNAQSKGGFDASKFNPPSDTEVLKGSYKVAWKSVESASSDPVDAVLQQTDIDKSKLRFEIGGRPIQVPAMGSGQTAKVLVPGQADGIAEDLLVLYTPSDTSKDQVLGKLKVASYSKINRTLVVVPVNEAAPQGLSATLIADSINAIYNQAIVNWAVSIHPTPITVALDAQFDDGESGLLTNYTGDMKKVIKAFGKLQDDTYYLFLVKNPKSGNALGYMPRGKQAGFIFADKHSSNQTLIRTMAHELGHGAFNLHHTFKEPNFPIAEGTTDNLMDYPSGNKLYKYQWDKIRYPDIVIGLFEEDEEGESVIAILDSKSSIKEEGNYFGFMTPGGQRIILSKDQHPIFYHGIIDDKYNDVIPGVLIGFRDKAAPGEPVFSGKQYWAEFEGGTFVGYKGYEYKKPTIASDDNSVLLGLPNARNDGKNFAIYKFKNQSIEDFSNKSIPVLPVISDKFKRLGFFTSANQYEQSSVHYRDAGNLIGDGQLQITDFELEMLKGKYVNIEEFFGNRISLPGFTSIPHDEYPEIFQIVKISEYYNRYSVFFKEYSTWFDKWNVLALLTRVSNTAAIVVPEDLVREALNNFGNSGEWEKLNITYGYVNSSSSEFTKWNNNLIKHNEELVDFYNQFLIGLQISAAGKAKDNIDCLKNISLKSDDEIYQCLIRASEDELARSGVLSDEDRLVAIKSVLKKFWVNGESEKVLVKLIKFTPPDFDSDNFVTQLESDCFEITVYTGDEVSPDSYKKTICLWEMLFTKINDGSFLFSGDNRKDLMLAFLKHFYRSEKFKTQLAEYKTSLEAFDLDVTETKRFEFDYNYQGIFRRLWTEIKQSYSPIYFGNPNDYYVTLNTTVLNEDIGGVASKIKINQDLQKGFFLSETKYTQNLYPFDLVIFTNKSNQDLLKDFSLKDENGKLLALPVPALALHYSSVVGNNETTSQLIQTGFDVGTLLIPGGQLAQLTKLGKVIYYADKISSIASIGGTAFKDDNPKLAKLFNYTSIATGVGSLASIVIGSKVKDVNKVEALLNNTSRQIVNNSLDVVGEINRLDGVGELSELSSRQADQLKQILDKDRKVLSEMGHLDEAAKVRFDDAIKLLSRVSVTVKEIENSIRASLIARGFSNSLIDDIIIRALYIDDVLKDNTMLKMVDRLTGNPKFSNADDLFSNLDNCFTKPKLAGEVDRLKAKTLLNELEEGEYWINRGEDVYISKKFTPGKKPENEVDVVLTTGQNKGIVECKFAGVEGANAQNNVYANLKEIVLKFKSDSKLESIWKNQYPKRYGQINISNGAFPNLNTPQQFVEAARKASIIGDEVGVSLFSLEELKGLDELHLLIGNKRIIIKSSDW
ncbi:fibronectin type III domain-containing protein [Chryseosolibacter indicus]|nr:fibronectin type III domain-containing protein [Chryseosolibacter indicus]